MNYALGKQNKHTRLMKKIAMGNIEMLRTKLVYQEFGVVFTLQLMVF